MAQASKGSKGWLPPLPLNTLKGLLLGGGGSRTKSSEPGKSPKDGNLGEENQYFYDEVGGGDVAEDTAARGTAAPECTRLRGCMTGLPVRFAGPVT